MVRSPGSGSFMELVSRRRSPPASCRRGPRTRSYPFSSVSGFQGSRGVLSAPPRRFLPSAAQGDILRAPPPAVKGLSRLFPGKGRFMGRFRRTTWGDALRLPFGPRTHSLHKPRKGAGRRECDPAFRGASPQGAPRRRGIPSALRRRPLLCKEAGRLSLRPASQIDR